MYGVKTSATTAGAGAGGTLAATGPGATLWLVLAAVTLVFVGMTLVQLVRRPAPHRP